jgi:putative FmdB family regulatory protein
MPTYEYVCTDCGNQLEVVQQMTEEPLTTCGVCGGTLRKVFHPAGILFKGSGFYATDYRKGPKEDSKAAQKPDTKTDKKPEKTTPTSSPKEKSA